MVCASGTSAGEPVGSCSAHFIHNDDALAQRQAAEYALVGVAATPERRLLAGDFNLEPNQLPAIYAGAENIACGTARCPTQPAIVPFNAIDYVFATPSPLHSALAPGCFDWASDHCLLRGQARWPA
jgi:endonuclease/exonuclease/phosphatase family metal-dependent hydrolase